MRGVVDLFTCAQFFNFRVAGTKAVIHPGEHVMPGQFRYGDDDDDNDDNDDDDDNVDDEDDCDDDGDGHDH